jgi:flagellar protein FliO/FliZ
LPSPTSAPISAPTGSIWKACCAPLYPHAETTPRPQRDTLTALADELSARPAPPRNPAAYVARPHPAEPRQEPRQEPRSEPRPEPHNPTAQPAAAAAPATPTAPAPSAPPVAEAATAADRSLADMAQRLEAALRKPVAPADARPSATPARAAPTSEQAQPADAAPLPTPPSEGKPLRPQATPAPSKTLLYESLEKEMANLLGRSTKT